VVLGRAGKQHAAIAGQTEPEPRPDSGQKDMGGPGPDAGVSAFELKFNKTVAAQVTGLLHSGRNRNTIAVGWQGCLTTPIKVDLDILRTNDNLDIGAIDIIARGK